MGSRRTAHDARPRPAVARAVAHGGLAGMHAQQALASWAASAPHLVLSLVAVRPRGGGSAVGATLRGGDHRARSRSAGCAGRWSGSPSTPPRPPSHDAPRCWPSANDYPTACRPTFSRLEGDLGQAVRAVRSHRQLLRRGPRRSHGSAMRVAQVHLAQTGGLATLLPQLGDALAGQQRVAEPLTILRAGADSSLRASAAIASTPSSSSRAKAPPSAAAGHRPWLPHAASAPPSWPAPCPTWSTCAWPIRARMPPPGSRSRWASPSSSPWRPTPTAPSRRQRRPARSTVRRSRRRTATRRSGSARAWSSVWPRKRVNSCSSRASAWPTGSTSSPASTSPTVRHGTRSWPRASTWTAPSPLPRRSPTTASSRPC